MTIYVRTEEGQQAAYNPQSAMPRKLRSLLKVIDGKTSVQVYMRSLRAFGDVEGVLRSLEMAGLITPLAQSFSIDSAILPQAIWSPAPPDALVNEKMFFQDTSPAVTQQMSTLVARGDVSDTQRTWALSQAKDAMASYVLLHCPKKAFSVLREIDEITSLEQLAATLAGYRELVSGAGDAHRAHIQVLNKLLQDNL